MNLLADLWRRLPVGLRELGLYGLASAAALAVDWGLLLVLHGAGLNYLVATAIGFSAGIAVTYGLSVSVVFRHRPIADRKREFAGFLGVGLAGLVLTQLLMAFWVERLAMAPGLAKIPTAGLVFIFNFTVRRALLFRAPRAQS
ncbi:GtrA family protein [Caulobacter sp. ErkDOM-E]|jgi:putative flippase GtrA|uniref:GtrA family protein n=1 Tax=Caulobacter sp. ErkDOM-E TaxID=3402778 RepID=UPI003AF5A5E6